MRCGIKKRLSEPPLSQENIGRRVETLPNILIAGFHQNSAFARDGQLGAICIQRLDRAGGFEMGGAWLGGAGRSNMNMLTSTS